MIFAPTNKPRNCNAAILFEDRLIEQVKCQKFLGVWFQEDLAWNTHIDKLAMELSKTAGCLYRLSTLVPPWLKISLYYALFYSRLTYCILIWVTTSQKNYNKLIVLQKRVLCAFEGYYGLVQNFRTTPFFIKHSMLKANQVYYYVRLMAYSSASTCCDLCDSVFQPTVVLLPLLSFGQASSRFPEVEQMSVQIRYLCCCSELLGGSFKVCL